MNRAVTACTFGPSQENDFRTMGYANIAMEVAQYSYAEIHSSRMIEVGSEVAGIGEQMIGLRWSIFKRSGPGG